MMILRSHGFSGRGLSLKLLVFSTQNCFRGVPVAGHGKFTVEFLFHRPRKTANLIDS